MRNSKEIDRSSRPSSDSARASGEALTTAIAGLNIKEEAKSAKSTRTSDEIHTPGGQNTAHTHTEVTRPLPPLPASVEPPPTPLKDSSPPARLPSVETDLPTRFKQKALFPESSSPAPFSKLPNAPPPPSGASQQLTSGASAPKPLSSTSAPPPPRSNASIPPPPPASSSSSSAAPSLPGTRGGARSYAVVGPDHGWNDAPELDAGTAKPAASSRNTASRMKASRRVYPGGAPGSANSSGTSTPVGTSTPPSAPSTGASTYSSRPPVMAPMSAAPPSNLPTLGQEKQTMLRTAMTSSLPAQAEPAYGSSSIGGRQMNDRSSHTESVQQDPSLQPTLFNVKALYDYGSGIWGDLSFSAGDYLDVTMVEESGWWKGRVTGSIGPSLSIPSNYVQVVDLVSTGSLFALNPSPPLTNPSDGIGSNTSLFSPTTTFFDSPSSSIEQGSLSTPSSSTSIPRPSWEDAFIFVPDPAAPGAKKGKWICRPCAGQELPEGKKRRIGEWTGYEATPSAIMTRAWEHWEKYHGLNE